MICFDKKIIFIHIPRCGGGSIKESLKEISDHWDSTPNNLQLKDYECRYKIELEDYFIFTCVRNPYDKLFSMFRYKKFKRQTLDTRDKNFNEWIVSLKQDKKWLGGIPQAAYLVTDKDVKIVLLRFEKLQKDFDDIMATLDFKEKQLDFINQLQKSRGFKLTAILENIVYNKYKIDFNTFGYERGIV